MPFTRLKPILHFISLHCVHVVVLDGADTDTETGGENSPFWQFKFELQSTPNLLFPLFTAAHVPVNGASVHKLAEHVFHTDAPPFS